MRCYSCVHGSVERQGEVLECCSCGEQWVDEQGARALDLNQHLRERFADILAEPWVDHHGREYRGHASHAKRHAVDYTWCETWVESGLIFSGEFRAA